ncbi:MAG: hypothetical protein ACE5EQ_03070 [Phycisphaerae bacterium]
MRYLKYVSCIVVLAWMTGCSGLTGTWTADHSSSSNSPIASVTFSQDHTFTASAQYGDNRSHAISGHYKQADGEIEFDMDGNLRKYGYELKGNELFLSHGDSTSRLVRMSSRD